MHNAAVWLVHLGFVAIAAAIVVAAGQPIFTDDLWWHLSLGASFSESGPWLDSDPLLFHAAAPPSTSSWLAEILFAAVNDAVGLFGLRFLHVALVALILGLAWSIFNRASTAAWQASLATAGFAILGAYRLVQLRPHLFTILAVLLLYRLLLEQRTRPGPLRIGLAALLVFLWVNLHGGFLLGLLLLGVASVAVCVSMLVAGTTSREKGRLGLLVAALVLAGMASLLNPAGFETHLAYFVAGADTPDLGRVIDEWKSFGFLRWPVSNLPPTPLAWVLGWVLLGLTAAGLMRGLRDQARTRRGGEVGPIDPALAGLAVASLVAMTVAVRFEWLGIFPILLGFQIFQGAGGLRNGGSRGSLATGVLATLAGVPLFFIYGPWPMISGGLSPSWESYRWAYPAAKYYGHGMGWLADVGLEGHLYTDYSLGGFAGHRLAPGLRTTWNGSLNVTRPVMAASVALGQRRGRAGDESFLDLLDQLEVDVFFGTGIPRASSKNRPGRYTTAHLEGEVGWILVFRNVRSAVYLRDNERNRENLDRVAAYYQAERVPFDLVHGFDAERVLWSAPEWAFRHGVAPSHLRSIQSLLQSRLPAERWSGQAELARLYALLGRYESAIQLDRQRLRAAPTAENIRQRLVWSLLRLGRFDEADQEAEALRSTEAEPMGLTRATANTARAAREAVTREEAVRRVILLPLLTPNEIKHMTRRFRVAEPRERR